MEPISEEIANYDQMVIIERYEKVIEYLYPIAQSIPRKHGIARNMFLNCLLSIPQLLYEAGKTNQATKIYIVDAALANLRYWLRFLTLPKVKCMTQHQHKITLVLIAEVGSMINSWIKKRKG